MSEDRPLRILLLASSYPRNRADHASIFLRHLAEHLCQRKIQVHVLAPADGKGGTKVEGNVTVHRFQYLPAGLQRLAYGSGILSNLRRRPWLWAQVPFFLASMIFALLRLIRKEQPHLIHAHWILPQGLIAVVTKYLHRVPVIATAHGADAFAFRGKFMARLKWVAVTQSNAWTANTRSTAGAIGDSALLTAPHVIIPMGINVEHFSRGDPGRLRRELPPDGLLVLFVGRLVEKKGCRDLLEAFSLLPSSLRARTSLWVVGEGELRDGLRKYATSMDIDQKVRFWGGISNHLLPDLYAAGDLFVAPSIEAESGDTEGQGVVLLEAFAARVCVLATRVGGIAEVVTDGATGVLVEPHHPKQLAVAMEKLLGDRFLRNRLAENAFQTVKQEYGWEKIAAQFEELYCKVRGLGQNPV